MTKYLLIGHWSLAALFRGDTGAVSSPTLGLKHSCSSPSSAEIQATTTPKSTDKEKSPVAPGDTITSLPISIPLSTVHPSKLPVSIPLASVVLPNRAERLVWICLGGSHDIQSCGCFLQLFKLWFSFGRGTLLVQFRILQDRAMASRLSRLPQVQSRCLLCLL